MMKPTQNWTILAVLILGAVADCDSNKRDCFWNIFRGILRLITPKPLPSISYQQDDQTQSMVGKSSIQK